MNSGIISQHNEHGNRLPGLPEMQPCRIFMEWYFSAYSCASNLTFIP